MQVLDSIEQSNEKRAIKLKERKIWWKREGTYDLLSSWSEHGPTQASDCLSRDDQQPIWQQRRCACLYQWPQWWGGYHHPTKMTKAFSVHSQQQQHQQQKIVTLFVRNNIPRKGFNRTPCDYQKELFSFPF